MTAAERQITDEMSASKLDHSFPEMRETFNAIAEVREMYRRLDLESRERKRSSAGLGRRVAHLPPRVFFFLTHHAPEILRNQHLLRTFLRENPQFLIVEKL